MKKVSLWKRIRYWLDRRMAKGTISMVKLLLLVVLFMAALVTVLVLVFHLKKGEGMHPVALLWDNIRAAMSSSFPESSSGPVFQIILYTFLGLTGMIFTGMLIGIFSTSMRGKILALQKENPEIIEKGHVVILGFRKGEYALLSQMMQAAYGEKRTVVVVENLERQEMEQSIRTNINVPKNIRMIVIKADTENAADMECVAIPAASTLVVNTRDKGRTVKTLLAVESLLRNTEKRPKIVANVDADTVIFPEDLLAEKGVSMLHSGDVVARIVAHAATQPGIFDAFLDIIDFENYEFYFESHPDLYGLPVWKAVLAAENGIVVGLYRGTEVLLNPAPETVIEQGDLLVVFEEEEGDVTFADLQESAFPARTPLPLRPVIPEVVIFGAGAALPTVLRELPDNVERIRLIGLSPQEATAPVLKDLTLPSEIVPDHRNTESEKILEEMVRNASHIVVLSDRKRKEEDADTETMIRIIRLRNIKKRFGLSFTITAEMRCENNRKLIADNNAEDFVVATDLSSMMLAQITEDTRRLPLFSVLLDEGGSEIYLKPADELGLSGKEMTLRELRHAVYSYGYILMGLRTEEEAFRVLDDYTKLTLGDSDRLVLIGEE